jgi:cytochrome c peroxidase
MAMKLRFSAYLQMLAAIVPLALAACGGGGSSQVAEPVAPATPVTLSSKAELGKMIFNDGNLSEPRGFACVACHQAHTGFAGNNGSTLGVAQGSKPGALGLRNTMTNSYVGFVPEFEFHTANGLTEAVGGHFWDGRADTLALQALGPFLNPMEMNNPDRKAVVDKIAASSYAESFKRMFGATIFSDTDAAFTNIGLAIDAFERAELQPFNSKYDALVLGKASFTAQESRGMALFMNPNKANCASCHLMNPGSGNPQDSLFSEFSYYATGVPRNTKIPKNADPAFYDLGLCGPDRSAPVLPATAAPGYTIDNFCGQFRMPTLRNVAERKAFMHNGFFTDLSEVVRFYSTRISDPTKWYGADVTTNDLPGKYINNIELVKAPFNRKASDGPLLTEAEITDVVAFLRTLSDGYKP